MECEICGRSANRTYVLHGRRLGICDLCFDRQELQDEYEGIILRIHKLSARGQYEEALNSLQELRDRLASRDHDGWLESSLLSHEGLLLRDEGRLNEALSKYRRRAERSFAEPSEYLANQLAIAQILMQVAEPDAAVDELDRGLQAAQDATVPSALPLLVLYAEIAAGGRRPVPAHYRTLLQKIVDWYEIPASPVLLRGASLASDILAIRDINRVAQVRYEELQSRLSRTEREDEARRLMEEFIDSESVGFFRQLVLRQLNTRAGESS